VVSPTTLYLLRHGEIDRPPVYRFDDAVLTERGIDQIHGLALRWTHAVPDMIYCSPLPRSVETASICAAVFRRPIRTVRDLEEWAATEMDVPEAAYKELERRCWEDPNYENDSGESLHHATDRIVRVLTEIAGRHEGRPVMVSGHAILFALLLAYVRGDRATEASKDRIAFGSHAIAEHREGFRVLRDFGPSGGAAPDM
jgi:broad specificity phosphatase PhoE